MKDFCKHLGDEPIDIFINNAGVYGPRDSNFGKVDEKNLATSASDKCCSPAITYTALN